RAVALALLGADATVVDISPSNAAYARELAEAAGVPLHYVVSDLLELPEAELTGDYDLAVMENGILHYFVDLLPVAQIIARLLRSGGRLVLQDFHPISTKLITSKGKKHKVTGNYFDMSLQEGPVAYSAVLEDVPHQVRVRKWTLGEIVTALADAGLHIRLLSEDPNTKLDDTGLPKTYTIVAEKL
ncbi:MAG: class I SAM-dependent methyltransferase, partial [Tumebacillaceae bacterium]